MPSDALPPTVLVVDDEPMIRSLLTEFLQLKNLRVVEACNGVEALRQVRHVGERPILLVTDLIMPAMGGLELLSEIRKDLPSLAALFVSGFYDDSLAITEAIDEKTRFLEKPFDFRMLDAQLEQLLPGHVQPRLVARRQRPVARQKPRWELPRSS